MNIQPDRHSVKIEVSDYGPIAEAKIDLRPLTVFVGPSNTGKSYLAILVYALHKFFSGAPSVPEIRAPSFRRESLVPFYFANPVPSSRDPGHDVQILTDWIQQLSTRQIHRGHWYELPEEVAALIRPQMRPGEDWKEMLPGELARCFGTTDANWLVRHSARHGAKFSLACLDHAKQDEVASARFDFSLTRHGFNADSAISDERPLHIDGNFARDLGRNFRFRRYTPEDDSTRQSRLQQSLIREIAAGVGSTTVSPLSHAAHYLPADRTGVMHAHQVVVASMIAGAPTAGLRPNAPLPSLSGVLSDFLIQLLSLGRIETNPRKGRENDLGSNIEARMLAGSIQADRSNPIYPVFTYLPAGWDSHLPLMNSSSMVSELAPVVLYLRYVVDPGDVLIIEEPESNLHPAMQVELVRQLARVVNYGVRVMLTTHSEWVLDELANLIHLSHLDSDKRQGSLKTAPALDESHVGVWRFEKEDGQDSGSRVSEIRLDLEQGGFASGYDQIARHTYNEWAVISNLIDRAESL